MPQGTVLGPLLFLAYINNLPSKVNAKARLLADDYLLYRHINRRGCSLYKITSTSYRTAWEANWQMHLNHDKCELIIGQLLPFWCCLLCVDPRLCLHIPLEASQMLCSIFGHVDRFLRRKAVVLLAYLVKVSMWVFQDSVLLKVRVDLGTWLSLFVSVENCEWDTLHWLCYAYWWFWLARFVTGDYWYTSSVTALTESLSWETLQHRRQQAKAIMMFRIVHAMVAIPASKHLQLLGAATRGHQYKYSPILQDQYIYLESVFLSSMRLRHQLPEKLTNAESLDTFKAGISAATLP